MKRKRRRSNAGLVIGLAFCLVFGAAFGYFMGGCSNQRPGTQARTTPPSQQQESHSPGNTSAHESDTAATPDDPADAPPPLLPAEGTGEVSSVESVHKEVALTFDAGASAEPADSILKTLAKHNLLVTFFLTGKWCEQNPDLVRRIFEAGHEIGNHTYSHKDLRKLNDSEIADELEKMAVQVRKLTGSDPAAIARPPYGGRDKRVLADIRADGYVPIYWSLDSLDAFKVGITSAEIHRRILDRIKNGDIVLLHCGSRPTADALESIITSLSDRGYSVVTVSSLINKS